MINRLLVLALTIGFGVLSLAGQETPPLESSAPLSPDQKFAQLLSEAQQFQSSNQLLDAMEKLTEAEALKPDAPIVLNMRGSIYTAMRDFDKAREAFTKSNSLAPDAFEPKFNLNELNYVQGKYKEAEAGFTELLNTYPKLRVDVRHITFFKILVCRLKQNNVSGAEETMKNFSNMDDTPAYYFAKAAFAFQKDDKIEGQRWINIAGQVFKQMENVPYLDTLIESRWIESLGIPDDLVK